MQPSGNPAPCLVYRDTSPADGPTPPSLGTGLTMSWELPAALLLGLTIPAIVLLWILKPLRPRLRVPSLLLWPGSPAERQSTRPWQRLRNHPLFWVQVAMALLL